MKNTFLKFLILPIFLLAGFFGFIKPASAIYATTTSPAYSDYDFRDVWGTFIADGRFWFDGEYYRFSFTPVRDFYTVWTHRGYDIISHTPFYVLGLNTNYFFQAGGGGSSSANFVENLDDLDGYETLETGRGIFFLWEEGHRYDTYLVQGSSASGITEDNIFLNWHFKDYPDDRLRPEYSSIQFFIQYLDRLNLSHSRLYIDYDYAPEPAEPDPVILIPGMLGSWPVNGIWQIDPIRRTYDNLIEAMIQAGYKLIGDDRNLFLFPYDWKVNNMLTADLLKDKIAEVKSITGSDKVDIVAHSMGGLVARAYVEDNDYNNDIDQVIFLGTPHLGSPKSYPTYEAGEFVGDISWFYKRFFQIYVLSNGYTDLTRYVRERVPTMEQVLPIYDYLKNFSNNEWQLRPYYENYPRNTFLEFLNLADRVDLLKQRTKVTNIVSGASFTNTSTIQFIKVVNDPNSNDNKWPHGEPENFVQNESAFEMGRGDGTVPYESANGLNGVNVIEVADDGHNALPTTRQQDIIEILTGERPENYYDSETLYAVKRWIFTAVFSPANLQIIAPDGRRIGKDFATGQIINEIDGAFYSGFGDGVEPEFIMIPEPVSGEYQIKLQGTSGGGEYKILSGTINEDNLAENQEFLIESAIMAGGEDRFALNYQPGSNAPVVFESEVDFDKLIALTKSLYGANEIKKKAVYEYLVNNFESLKKQTEKFGRLKNKNLSRILAKVVELRLRLMLKELDFYLKKDWVSVQANAILKSNINLLINKL